MTPWILAAGLAAFLLLQVVARNRATAATEQASADPAAEADTTWQSVDLWGMTTGAIEARALDQAVSGTDQAAVNVSAFLATISKSEGTDRAADPYRVCYGYRHTIQDLSEHPAVKTSTHPVEWAGEPLDNLGLAYAGKVSTAAGRYQIIRPTWLDHKARAGLSDFGPASQDLAAVSIIKAAGALSDVQAGRFAQAIDKCKGQWASLPGANVAGQPMRRLADLQLAYVANGGTVA